MSGVTLGLVALIVGATPAPPAATTAPPVSVRAALERTPVQVGDEARLDLQVTAPDGYDVELPALGDTLAGLPIAGVEHTAPHPVGHDTALGLRCRLRTEKPGAYVLEPLEVRYRASAQEAWKSVKSDELFLDVVATAPASGGPSDIRDIKPLVRVRSPWRYVLWALAVLALVAAAVALWRRLRRRRRASDDLPTLAADPPAAVALAALAALTDALSDDEEALRRAYFHASEIVRLYVERRFGLNATDLTTEEIVAALAGVPGLADDASSELAAFLHRADAVKFAGQRPDRSAALALIDSGRNFVRRTEPLPATQESAA